MSAAGGITTTPGAASASAAGSAPASGAAAAAGNGYRIPPGPRLPRAVQSLGWIKRPLAYMEQCRERYGDIFTLRVAQEGTWVFLADPEAVKQVFTGDPNVLQAGAANIVLEPVLGRNSVLLLDEPQHMRQRKLMLPPFHGERMQRYGELMAAAAAQEIERWPVGEPLALWPSMQAITLEVIMRAVFGIEQDDELEQLRGRLLALLNWTTDPRLLFAMALLGPLRFSRMGAFRRALAPVHEALVAEVRRRREDPRLAERDDILSLLVQARDEDGAALSDEELRDELMTLLLAGHETTATSLAWGIERLLRHPDKLARVRAEAQAGEDEYLDAVVKETLRLRPVLPIVVRKLAEPMEIGGWPLPAGVSVAPCIYLIHRRADIYPDPHGFRPERFLERPAGTYTWIPFGGGVRRCLGASFALFEMKTVLATVVASAQLRAVSGEPERIRRRAITLTPSDGALAVADSVTVRPVAAGHGASNGAAKSAAAGAGA